MINKLALGTVQFGLDYGINNNSGQVSSESVEEILAYAKSKGIDTIDTAFAYGNSETVLGRTDSLSDFKVVSKLPTEVRNNPKYFLDLSLKNLGLSRMYGYLLHNFSIYKEDKTIWQELIALKRDGLIEKIGVSLYSVEELEELWSDNVQLDLVQVPYNLFDRRFDKVLPELKERGVEVHTRSTFLQGLFFMHLDQLPDYFNSIKEKLLFLKEYSKETNISIASLCLAFVLSNPKIDKIVIGVDNKNQLIENIKTEEYLKQIDFTVFRELKTDILEIINPALWEI